MSRHRPHEVDVYPAGAPESGTVAAGAERILAEREHVTGETPDRPASDAAAADLRAELEGELGAAREKMAGIKRDLSRVHRQLDQINAGIIGLQSQRLRQAGVVALVLAVLVAITWKVIEG